ncbi:MAG: hypothetical protein ACOCUT_04100, partial [bacterium]
FTLSSAGTFSINITDISNASEEGVKLNVTEAEISNDTTTYGYVTIQGETNADNTIDEDVNFTVTPYRIGEGYYSAIYEQTGTNWVNGNLQRGDIVRLCYEAPGEGTSEDQLVRLNFVPKIGTPTLTEFVTPDVISTNRVYLYP